MRSNVTNRIQFEHIAAGILNIIDKPSYYHQFGNLIYPELIYPNDQSDKVDAIRVILKLLKELAIEKRVDEFTIKFIQNELPLRMQDEIKSKKVSALFASWIADDSIMSLMNDQGAFNSFVSYVKALQIFNIADSFSKKLNSNRVDDAVADMQQALGNIATIANHDRETLKYNEALSIIEGDNRTDVPKQVLLLDCPPLDESLGGFERQTLNVFASITNGGKSMMAHHLVARCIESKIHVWVGAVEDRKKSFAYKLMSRLSGISMRRLKNEYHKLTLIERNLLQQANEAINAYVHVDFLYGSNIDAVHKASLDHDLDCKIHDRPVPMVNIVDYTGHIARGSYGDKMFEKMRSAYGSRKDFVLQHDKIGFDFAQINREGSKSMASNHIITHNDLAGAFDLSHVCDTIISLNRSEEDIINGTTRLHVCKARDAAVGATILVKTEFHKAKYNMLDWTFISGNSELHDICRDISAKRRSQIESSKQTEPNEGKTGITSN